MTVLTAQQVADTKAAWQGTMCEVVAAEVVLDLVETIEDAWRRLAEANEAFDECTGDPVEIRALDNDEETKPDGEACICTRFGDTGGYRIADLTCPVHGIHGPDPGDGYWDDAQPSPPVVCLACQEGRHALCYGGTCGCGCEDQEPGM